MKIISRYILREHVGPFAFALTALTSLMILNFISRQFGELVGKGLPASVIAEFFGLSIPFTIALTLPMSVLVAVLYAFSRLAAENEVTALKASGVSPWRLVTPALVWGAVMSLFLLAFNDQVLPRANFRLKTLQDDIAQTKPTFLLKPQVINSLSEERFYLKAGRIDQSNGHMREVVIYDLTSPDRRRTIYADSGVIGFAPNLKDLEMDLFSGQMQTVSTDKPAQLDRLFYKSDRITVRNVGGRLNRREGDTLSRGDRELGVCAMQKRLVRAKATYEDLRIEYMERLRLAKLRAEKKVAVGMPVHRRPRIKLEEPKNLAWAYCRGLSRLIGVKAAEAAELRVANLHFVQDTVRRSAQQDSAKRDSVRRATADSALRAAAAATALPPVPPGRKAILGISPAQGTPATTPVPTPVPAPVQGQSQPGTPASTFKDPFLATTKQDSQRVEQTTERMTETELAESISRTADVKLQYDIAQRTKNRYEIEINKKFALAAACLIFVILGAPLALRFPRGGVGLVLLVSLVVFALYYVGLIGGESLANKGIISPFWAMWGTNVILTIVGVILLLRMGHEENSGRGGNWG
ncbi:MAG TPA: LptF/LptG family permease, partial [Gemmatimonadaceae bacterium]|nr:LptF/LptG family permease [Gemmatimonadaceae bacterium]